MTKLLYSLLFTGLPFLVACTATHSPADTDADAGTARVVSKVSGQIVPEPEEPVEYGSFSREQLELALLSELGGMRGYLPQAAEGYYRLAMDTRDIQIIRRAVEFASALGEIEVMADLATIWMEQDPQALDPNLILGYQLLEQGLFVRAMAYLDTVLELGGSVDFTALSARTFTLENRQRDVIAEQLRELMTRFPAEPSLYYALAQIHDQNGDNESAGEMLAMSRNRFGDNPRTALIEAQLLQNTGQAETAEQVLGTAVSQYPLHRLLRYSYAQILVQNNKLPDAAIQFNELIRQEPQDYETLYSLALINLELEELDAAEGQLRTLLQARHRANEARFYLGYILEARSRPAEALGYYQQINQQSNAFLTAQRQIMRLLIELERFDEARAWTRRSGREDERLAAILPTLEAEALLNGGHDTRAAQVIDEALLRFPDNTDLLFARTLLSERLDDMAQIESDLRRIIRINPDDARALNHLGYALTVRTDRYDEALALIERAIAVTPDDPAIIDSLGWVQYKLGDYQAALRNLRRAYDAFPDPEVAAHLGEVLWVTGSEQEALEIWQQALEEDPQSEHVLETMERLVHAK
jgi:tetratricopeptide (TPR) repeat protein